MGTKHSPYTQYKPQAEITVTSKPATPYVLTETGAL